MQRARVGQIRVAPEQAVDHRTDEASLQEITRLRLLQRQRRQQGQVDGTTAAARA